jgi:DNA-binding MarR family transcriptional regulator
MSVMSRRITNGSGNWLKSLLVGALVLLTMAMAGPKRMWLAHRAPAHSGMPGAAAVLHACKTRRKTRTSAPPARSIAGIQGPPGQERPVSLADGSASDGSASDGNAVVEAIGQIVRSMRLSGRDAERRMGLSGAQLLILQKLNSAGLQRPLSVNELANLTQTGPSSVSEVVGRLASLGLVARARCAADGRSVKVSLTGTGELLLQEAPALAHDLVAASVARMPEPDRQQLARLLGQLANQMEAPPQPAALAPAA